jgi:hypothetical protein
VQSFIRKNVSRFKDETPRTIISSIVSVQSAVMVGMRGVEKTMEGFRAEVGSEPAAALAHYQF